MCANNYKWFYVIYDDKDYLQVAIEKKSFRKPTNESKTYKS